MVSREAESEPNVSSINQLFAQPPEVQHAGVRNKSLYLPMRDGVQIAVDVMLPADLRDGQRIPALLIMARYWRSFDMRVPDQPNKALIGPRERTADYLIARGFALVVVDSRGSGASTGVVRFPWSPEELADYAEVAAWVSEQPWCSGRVGAYGISYEGATAQRLAAQGVPAVRAVAPQEIEYDVYTDVLSPGGVFNRAFIEQWHASNARLDNHQTSDLFPWIARLIIKGPRPVDDDRATRAMLRRAKQEHQANVDVYAAARSMTFRDDPFGSSGVTTDDFSLSRTQSAIEQGGAALFTWGSWLDAATADAALRNFNTLNNPQIAVIGAWKHEMTAHGSPFKPPKAKPSPSHDDQVAALAQFFTSTLKDERPPAGKRLYYYTMGEEVWKQTDTFPLPDQQTEAWYFQPDHGLARTIPVADEASDTYTVDPAATTGNTNRWQTQMARPLVYPNRADADRRLLTYTSAPLDRDLEITGYPVITLYVASDTTDGAFFAYLEEVDEAGVVRYLTEGQLRGIHRKLADEPAPSWIGMPYRTFRRADAQPLPVGEVVELTFGLLPVSVLVRRGRRLRVALAGADADTFAPVPGHETPTWQVQRGRMHTSRINLPVIPR